MFLKTAVHVPQLRSFWEHDRLASCGGDRSVFSWDVATGRIIRKFRGHDGVANSVSLACSASHLPLASASTLWYSRALGGLCHQPQSCAGSILTFVLCCRLHMPQVMRFWSLVVMTRRLECGIADQGHSSQSRQ